MDKRILAVLVAAIAGAGVTAAQAAPAYVTTNNGNVVSNGVGGCWQTGASGGSAAACPPGAVAGGTSNTSAAPAREQVAQASSPGAYRRSAAAGASTATLTPAAQSDAYVISGGSRNVVVDGAGQCVRTGAWTPAMAAEPCAAVARASTALPVVAAAPEPPPAPVAQAAPETPRPVIERVNLSTDVLFAFDKAQLRPEGKDKLDELAQKSQNAEVDKVVLTGYADPIGKEKYNKDLSERRAQAVADYLSSKGIDQSRLEVEGRGEDTSITGGKCDNMGPLRASNKKLVQCFQPDRRVEAELLGRREVAAGSAPSATGATGTGSSTGMGQGTSGSSR